MKKEGTLYRDMSLDDLIEVLQEQKAQGVTRVLFGYGVGSCTSNVHVIETSRTRIIDDEPTPQELWGVLLMAHQHTWDEEAKDE